MSCAPQPRSTPANLVCIGVKAAKQGKKFIKTTDHAIVLSMLIV